MMANFAKNQPYYAIMEPGMEGRLPRARRATPAGLHPEEIDRI